MAVSSTTMEEEATTVDAVASALDAAWLFVCLVLVIMMQPGFAALEVHMHERNRDREK